MRVLVIKLAIPNPWGNRSIQKWKAEVLSPQKHTRRLAKMVSRDETRVNV
jgi:hypothetical protein